LNDNSVREEQFDEFVRTKLSEARAITAKAREDNDMERAKKYWKVEDVIVKMAIRLVNLKSMKVVAIQNEDYMAAKQIV
jgi:hypothetical protein